MHGPHDDGFEQIVHHGMQPPTTPPNWADPTPYGTSAGHAHTAKTGLTTRGKAALGLGAAVLAGGTLIGYQIHTSNAANQATKAQELHLKTQAIELERLRELNRAAEVDRKTAAAETKTMQARVDSCVKRNGEQADKSYGSTSYRQIVDDCRAQYNPASTTANMQAAGTANTPSDGSGGGVNDAALIGVGALAILGYAFARRGTRSNPA
ncbi:hypothetical protein DBP19_36445 [Streptomyces sp. CS090A]|uniref:hypothetical protein n=1 Tax=Streptomyces sp. CS090A TaxID=2162710 RepID=UPI000D521577|nr:hypothetical protein [Streptomyces sp. CS090A]PVC80631.1 hypothetical protein DBP19_36445 [Streptomyces sp. CS090A]